MLQQALTAFLT